MKVIIVLFLLVAGGGWVVSMWELINLFNPLAILLITILIMAYLFLSSLVLHERRGTAKYLVYCSILFLIPILKNLFQLTESTVGVVVLSILLIICFWVENDNIGVLNVLLGLFVTPIIIGVNGIPAFVLFIAWTMIIYFVVSRLSQHRVQHPLF